MMPRRERARSFLRGLVKFVALVAVAGGCGVGIGYGLSTLSDETSLAGTVATGDTQTATRPAITPRPAPTATTPPPAGTATTPPPPTQTATATTPTFAGALGEVQVRVLGAILRPAGTPDGQARRRARLTMRVQAVNEAEQAVTIGRPVVAIGKVRVRTDTAAQTAESELGEIAAGATKAATMRFELAGEATEKITIDRRARIDIAGRSLAFRVTIGAPVKPPRAQDDAILSP